VNRRPDALGLENPAYSPALDRIVFKCLEKDPENRYGAARQLAGELAQLQSQSERVPAAASVGNGPTGARKAPSSERRDEPTKLWQLNGKTNPPGYGAAATVTGLIILLVAAAAGFYLVHNPVGRVAFSIAEVAILALAGWWWIYRRPEDRRRRLGDVAGRSGAPPLAGGSGAGGQQRSLAVLPFAN